MPISQYQTLNTGLLREGSGGNMRLEQQVTAARTNPPVARNLNLDTITANGQIGTLTGQNLAQNLTQEKSLNNGQHIAQHNGQNIGQNSAQNQLQNPGNNMQPPMPEVRSEVIRDIIETERKRGRYFDSEKVTFVTKLYKELRQFELYAPKDQALVFQPLSGYREI